jgi:hypothetical protein
VTSLPFNESATRPGLVYQHAFDWVAVRLRAVHGPGVCLVSRPFVSAEMSRRLADVPLVCVPEDSALITGTLDLSWIPPLEPQEGTLVAVAWIEPLEQDFVRLEAIRRWLRPDGQLYLVVSGGLARFLAERRTLAAMPYVDERDATRGLDRQGFQVRERLGLHGSRAVAWHLLNVIATRLGRPHWQDRCYAGMRRDFVSYRGPAALACIVAEVVA